MNITKPTAAERKRAARYAEGYNRCADRWNNEESDGGVSPRIRCGYN